MPQEGDSLLKVDTPAKINLWLEVIRKRDDGYHELSSLMLPIAIYDSLEIGLNSGQGISLVCSGFEAPEDSGNLVWRAAQNFLTASGLNCGVDIRLRKSIPVGAGLGGGSSDAAAVLLGLNSLSGSRLPGERLHELARGLGADVPFFLYRVASLATGIGEKLLRVAGLPRYGVLLVKPSVSVSTAWVYRSLKLTRGRSRIKLRTFLDRPWRLPDVLENDLEAVTLEAYPLLSNIKEWLLENGALGALMSGSGPTVFGIYPNGNDARKVASSAVREWNECWVSAAETL